jgi:hypothetical protein
LPKFWCSLAWIKQYLSDCKRLPREQCDCKMPILEATFLVALVTPCPVTQICKFMQRSLGHVEALHAIGRGGEFSRAPSLRHADKSRRRAEQFAFESRARRKSVAARTGGRCCARGALQRRTWPLRPLKPPSKQPLRKKATTAAEAAITAALRALGEEKARAEAALASARAAVQRVAEEAAADAAADARRRRGVPTAKTAA